MAEESKDSEQQSLAANPTRSNAGPARPKPSLLENTFSDNTRLLQMTQFLSPEDRENLKTASGYLKETATLTDLHTELMQYGPDFNALKALKAGEKAWSETSKKIPKISAASPIKQVVEHLVKYLHYHPHLVMEPLTAKELLALLRTSDDEILKACPARISKIEEPGSSSAAAYQRTTTDLRQQYTTDIRRRAMMATLRFLPEDGLREFISWLTRSLPIMDTVKDAVVALDGTNFVHLFESLFNSANFSDIGTRTRKVLGERALALDKVDCTRLFSTVSFPKFMQSMPKQIQHDFVRYMEGLDFISFQKIRAKADGLWNFVDEDALKAIREKITHRFAQSLHLNIVELNTIIQEAVMENIESENSSILKCLNGEGFTELLRLLQQEELTECKERLVYALSRCKDDDFAKLITLTYEKNSYRPYNRRLRPQGHRFLPVDFTPEQEALVAARYFGCSSIFKRLDRKDFLKLLDLLESEEFTKYRGPFVHALLHCEDDDFARLMRFPYENDMNYPFEFLLPLAGHRFLSPYFTPGQEALVRGRYFACKSIAYKNKKDLNISENLNSSSGRLMYFLSVPLAFYLFFLYTGLVVTLINPVIALPMFAFLLAGLTLDYAVFRSPNLLKNPIVRGMATVCFIIIVVSTMLETPILSLAPVIMGLLFASYEIFKRVRERVGETRRRSVNTAGLVLLGVCAALTSIAIVFMIFSMDTLITFFMSAGLIGLISFAVSTIITMAVFSLYVDYDWRQTEMYAVKYIRYKEAHLFSPLNLTPSEAAAIEVRARPTEADEADFSPVEDDKGNDALTSTFHAPTPASDAPTPASDAPTPTSRDLFAGSRYEVAGTQQHYLAQLRGYLRCLDCCGLFSKRARGVALEEEPSRSETNSDSKNSPYYL